MQSEAEQNTTRSEAPLPVTCRYDSGDPSQTEASRTAPPFTRTEVQASASESSSIQMFCCPRCVETFPLTADYFYRNRSRPNGFSGFCKRCETVTDKARRATPEGKVRRSPEGRERQRISAQQWRERHRGTAEFKAKRKVSNAVYRKKPHARLAARERDRRDYQKPEVRLRIALNTLLRKTRRAQLPATFTLADWQVALRYWKDACAVCGNTPLLWQTRLAMDHWIPLNSPSCPGAIPTNLVPLCNGKGGCNQFKQHYDPLIWLTARYGLEKAHQIINRIEQYFSTLQPVLSIAHAQGATRA